LVREKSLLSSIRAICKSSAGLEFFFPNQSFKFARFLKGTNWIAKHFSITSKKLGKTRYYSVCLCLNQIMYAKHKMLLDNIRKREENDSTLGNPKIDKEEMYSSCLELFVKKYDFEGALSKYLHAYDTQSANHEDIFVIGPIGLGLDIDPKLSGVYVCMAGGTGAYCFLDFVAYILRYMVSQINKQLDLTENSIDADEEFSDIGEDFCLVYMSSFSDKDNGVYTDVCSELQRLDNKYNLNRFKFINRFSDSQPKQPRWSTGFIKEQLGVFTGKISKVFLCGPTPFLDDSQENLLSSGLVSKEQIRFV